MKIGSKLLGGAFALALTMSGFTAAHAGQMYDYTLLSPDNGTTPGFFNGSGNPADHFTADVNASGVIAALGVQYRYSGPQVAPNSGTSIYQVNTGTNVTHGGSLWGFEFSVNTVVPNLNMSQYTTVLSLIDEVNGTHGAGFDTRAIPDNSGWDGTSVNTASLAFPADTIIQNAETLSFSSIAAALGDPAFDPNANNTYHFNLSVYGSCSGTVSTPCTQPLPLLASTDMTVIAGSGAPSPVPEPASLALLGVGLVALGSIRYARRPNTVA